MIVIAPAKSSLPMKTIIHLSDLHVGYAHCLVHLNRVITNLIFLKEPAGKYVVIVSGDLVNDATRDGLYEIVAAEIQRLRTAGFTVLICPGNHDYGTGVRGFKQYVGKFARTFLGKVDVSYPKLDLIDGTAFIGLDTMAEELNWYDSLFAEGELGGKQLAALASLLKTPPVRQSEKRVLYLHHHPFEPRPFHGLKDSERLGRVIAGKVDALLLGHNHDGGVFNGKWGIPRCYDGGSSTRKEMDNPNKLSPHRVIDLNRDPRFDYDGNFH